MTWHARDGGAWRTITAPYVRVAGVWQPVKEGWVRVSGVWQRFFNAVSVQITDRTVSALGLGIDGATATYSLNSDGTVRNQTGTVLEDWITPTSAAGADYEARATLTSGSISSGSTGVWEALSSTRSWTNERPPGSLDGTTSGVLLIEIRRASDGVVLADANVTVEATTFTP